MNAAVACFCSLLLCGTAFCVGTVHGQIIAEYQAGQVGPAPHPATPAGGNWELCPCLPNGITPGIGTTTTEAVEVDGLPALRITDPSSDLFTRSWWTSTTTSGEQELLANRGWELSVELRITDPLNDDQQLGNQDSIFFSYNAPNFDYWVVFDLDRNGAGEESLAGLVLGAASFTIPLIAPENSPAASEFHTVKLKAPPTPIPDQPPIRISASVTAPPEAELWFDDRLLLTFAPREHFDRRGLGVSFGAASSPGTGVGDFRSVVLEALPVPEPSSLLLLAVGLSSVLLARPGIRWRIRPA